MESHVWKMGWNRWLNLLNGDQRNANRHRKYVGSHGKRGEISRTPASRSDCSSTGWSDGLLPHRLDASEHLALEVGFRVIHALAFGAVLLGYRSFGTPPLKQDFQYRARGQNIGSASSSADRMYLLYPEAFRYTSDSLA